MKKTLLLKNPIMINNEEVKELTYDASEISSVLFATADAARRNAAGAQITMIPAAEFDFGLHLYLGLAAIIAVNPQYDFSDMERIHGADVVEVMHIGRNFIMQSEASQPGKSEEHSETTAEPSTQALPTSKGKG